MNEPIITGEHISKKFCLNLRRSLWYGVKDVAGELALRRNSRDTLRREEFWALKDVSFELYKGETLGLVGHNGAGKSTLLKLFNGIFKPDVGRISIHGRIGALIELGAGFNPILTGRENIYINAAVLGLRKKEISRRIDEIIEFADIGDFIDAPVRNLSSGMKVRLGFSVASHLEPDIFLIDEVLAVGDPSFRERCYQRLVDYKRNGGTVVFVSHNSLAVEAISDRVLVLERGQVVDVGEPNATLMQYEQSMAKISRSVGLRDSQGRSPNTTEIPSDDLSITSMEFLDLTGQNKSEFHYGEPFEIRVNYKASKDILHPYFIFAIRKGTARDPIVTSMGMAWDGITLNSLPQQGNVGCEICSPTFTPGTYSVNVGVQAVRPGTPGQKWYSRPREIATFDVVVDGVQAEFPGIPATHAVSGMPPLMLSHTWKIGSQYLPSPNGKDQTP